MKAILFAILMIAVGPGLFYMDGAIVSDFLLAGEKLVDAGIRTANRKCKRFNFAYHDCEFTYKLDGVTTRQSYKMLAFSGPETLTLLRGVDSKLITSDVGQNYLWNRIITPFIPFFLGLLMLIGLMRGRFDTPSGSRQRLTLHI